MIKTLLKLVVPLIASNREGIVTAIRNRITVVDSRPITGSEKFGLVKAFARTQLADKAPLLVDTLVQILVYLAKS